MLVEFTDFKNEISWSCELTEQDNIFLNDFWCTKDELLVGLSESPMFEGKTRWSELELINYQILFSRCFDHLSRETPTDALSIRFKEPFLTFKFFASCLDKFARTEGIIGFDNIRIMREESNRILISFNRTFDFDWNKVVPMPKKEQPRFPFRVIVDNTKDGSL